MKRITISITILLSTVFVATAQRTFTFTSDGKTTKVDSSASMLKKVDVEMPRQIQFKGKPEDGKRPTETDFMNTIFKTSDGKIISKEESEVLGKQWGGVIMVYDLSKKPLECAILPMPKEEIDKANAGGTIHDQRVKFMSKWLNNALVTKPFQDINGRIWDKNTLKGKIVVFNFWFVNCKPCIAEMPKLNAIVEKFKRRTDIIFLAPALDTKEVLQKFLTNNVFDYNVIPNEGEYQQMQLGITSWPTHIILDTNGFVRFIKTGNDETVEREIIASIESLLPK